MKVRVERHQIRSPTRLGFIFAAPVVFLCGVYLSMFLALNSLQGASILARFLSSAVAGSLEFQSMRVEPDLVSLTLFDAKVIDLRGRTAVEAETLSCSFSPGGLVRRRIMFYDCSGRGGRVLAFEQENGGVGLMEAFEGEFRSKNNVRPPPVISFADLNLHDVDVLIVLSDLTIRLDQVSLTEGYLESGRGHMELNANASARSGRILMSDRLVGLGVGKTSWEMVEWEAGRLARPWTASEAPAPSPDEGERGILDIPLDDVRIDRLRWRGESMELERLLLAGRDVRFDGSGTLRMTPERPKLAGPERGVMRYDGRATIAMPPDSAVLAWVLPGVFGHADEDSPRADAFAPLEFDGYGSVRFFDGETRLRLRDVRLLDWRVDALDAALSWRDGVMRLHEGAEAEIFGGQLTGSGHLATEDGTWALHLCADRLDLGAAAAPYVEAGSSLAELFGAVLSTTPTRCEPGAAVGLTLGGDLTLKALEIAPAADTPPEKVVQPPMIVGAFRDLHLRWLRPPLGLPFRALRAGATASLSQRGVLTFESPMGAGLTLATAGERVELTGALDVTTGQLTRSRASIRTADLGAWMKVLGSPLTPRGTSLVASLQLSGDVSAPDVHAITVRVDKPLGGDGLPPFNVEAAMEVDGDRLEVSALTFDSPFGAARLQGSIGLFDGSVYAVRSDPQLDLAIDLDDVDVGLLAPDLGIDAVFDAELSLTGTARSPRVEGTALELFEFRAFGEPIDYLSVGSYVLSDNVIAASDLLLIKGKGVLEADLSIDFAGRTLDVSAHGRRFRLGELRRTAERGTRLWGDVDFDVTASGTFEDPQLAGRVVIEGLRAQGVGVGNVALTFYTFEGVVEAAAQAASDLDIYAWIPLDGSPWRVRGSVTRAPLEEHLPALEGVIDRSAITATAILELDPFGAGVHRGELEISAAELRIAARTFDVSSPATVTWEARPTADGTTEQTIALRDLRVGTLGRYLDVVGDLSLGPDGDTVDLRIAGESDVSLLRFVPDLIVDAEGLADVELDVTGDLESPVIRGAIAFEQARIAPRGLGTSIQFGPGRLVIADEAIRVASDAPLSGTLFGGDFTAWGEIGLRGLTPHSVDYRMFVTNLAYRVPNTINVTLTSDNLRFTAPKLNDTTTWRLAGDIEIVDARYYQNIDVVGGTLSFGGFGRTVGRFTLPVWMRVPAVGDMTADLNIRGRDRFMVQNTIATAELDLEFRTDLRLTGRIGAMVLEGEMEALEGSIVTYRGRRFEVQAATMTFRGQRDEFGYPMPMLDAELAASIRPCVRRAQTSSFDFGSSARALDETGQVFLTAFLRGQLPYDLTFQLQSTPFYDQRDQLSLILTGCTVDELTASEAGGRTLEVVLAPVIDVVERNVEERLSIDEVNLIPTSQGAAGIMIQDEVSERFRWALDATVGSDIAGNQQLLRGEYRLFDWLLIEIQEQSSRGQAIAIDTGFRFRLRLD